MAKNNPAANEVAKEEKSKTPPTPELSTVSVDKETGELMSQETTQPQTEVLPPIEARLKKLLELQELVDKRDVIVQHLDNLNKFYISPSGQGSNLKLTDSKGNSFGISHPIIIGEIVHMSKAKLQDELTRIENAFVFTI